jgi:hypothetical protein
MKSSMTASASLPAGSGAALQPAGQRPDAPVPVDRRDHVFLYAFDLIELGGDDLRREPLEVRKATLASVLAKAGPGIRFNEHLDYDDGGAVFQHACKMGLEGIVSKRKDSLYRSGRSPDWLKMKNPACEAREWARLHLTQCRMWVRRPSRKRLDAPRLRSALDPGPQRSGIRVPVLGRRSVARFLLGLDGCYGVSRLLLRLREFPDLAL